MERTVKVADLLAVGTRDPQTGGLVRDAAILGSIAADIAGNLMVTWQDARFSGGARDAVAFARSTDAGATWTKPAAINGSLAVAAFAPVVTARADGTIGIVYYDFRDDTPVTTTLLTDVWLARSIDAGLTWTETRIAGPFDLDFAPRTDGGLFLGDYEALGATATRFVTLFAVANADAANRTDIDAPTTALLAREAAASARAPLVAVTDADVSPALRREASGALLHALGSRWPGWKPPRP